MGFNINNNYGPNIEVNEGGVVNLHQSKDGLWSIVETEDAEVVEQVTPQNPNNNTNLNRDEKQFQFIHYSIPKEEGWTIHDEIKNLVTRQKIQMICKCLMEMHNDKKLLLPSENPSVVYKELVRMGMPNGKGFSEVTFRKYYMTKK